MAKFADDQAEGISRQLDKRARSLTRKDTDPVVAGRAIKEGITGKGTGFISRFRNKQSKLYDELEATLPKKTEISVKNMEDELYRMTSSIPGAENVSKGHLISKELAILYDDLIADLSLTKTGKLPFSAVKELRSRIGKKVETIDLVSDIKKAEWKQIYGALSRDLETAVTATKDPKTIAAWNRANNYTKAGHDRIDMIEHVIKRKGGPEKIFQAVMSGTKEGATVLRSAMQSLDSEGRRILSATVLRRLGKATAGKQNAAGDLFSTETFLTNWANLSSQAKSTLFGRYGTTFRNDIDKIARVAENLRAGTGVFRNTSGTTRQGYLIGWLMALGTGIVSGNAPMVGGALVSAAGANRMAAAMTNPNFVRWLAKSTAMPVAAIPAQINILTQQARATGDEDIAWVASYLEQYQKEANQNKGSPTNELQ